MNEERVDKVGLKAMLINAMFFLLHFKRGENLFLMIIVLFKIIFVMGTGKEIYDLRVRMLSSTKAAKSKIKPSF